MSFIASMYQNLDRAAQRPLIVEVHGERLVETEGGDGAHLTSSSDVSKRSLSAQASS